MQQQSAVLLHLDLDQAGEWQAALRACIKAAGSRLYLWLQGNIAQLQDLQAILDPGLPGPSARQVADRLNNIRQQPAFKPLAVQAVEVQGSGTASGALAEPAEAIEARPHDARAALQYESVAVGGTFDRLHAGHRLLLAATALVSTHMVYVGVTSDKLLQNKEHAELLQPFEQRKQAAVDFLLACRPGLKVQYGALSDPKEPTAAATMDRMQALIVSKETIKGAEEVNSWRKQHGFKSLAIIIVDLVGGEHGSSDASKLSSTLLRQQEAAAAGKRTA